MSKLEIAKQAIIDRAQAEADMLHKSNKWEYRVRWLFNGANIEVKSTITGGWYTVKVVR